MVNRPNLNGDLMSKVSNLNSKQVYWIYLISLLGFIVGLYFIFGGFEAAFIALAPGLIGAPYLVYHEEFQHGIVLVSLSLSWILIYLIILG